MKRLKESKVELVHIGSIFALREMHSVFGGEMFSEKDRKYLEQLKIKGATNTLRDEVENLINELEGRRYVFLLFIQKYCASVLFFKWLDCIISKSRYKKFKARSHCSNIYMVFWKFIN